MICPLDGKAHVRIVGQLTPSHNGHIQVPDDNPVQALALAKQITIAVYAGARNLGGDLGPVLCPPK